MCESNVYLAGEGGEGGETLLMENVGWMEIDGDAIRMKDIDGVERTVRARIKYADLVQHKVVLQPSPA